MTVSLDEVRRNKEDWIEPMSNEYHALVKETKSVTPVRLSDVEGEDIEIIPGKLVCVKKGGSGKRRARAVVCGNHVNAEADRSPYGVYASGADGTLIRSVLRKSIHQQWRVSTADVKTAFLLAPRPQPENAPRVLVRPPRIMAECGVCDPQELWSVNTALYGFQSSPSHWAVYRDNTVRKFRWQGQQGDYFMKQSKELNLWQVFKVNKGDLDKKDAPKTQVGLAVFYVDDILIAAEPEARDGFLQTLQETWKCSPPEHVSSQSWTRFCGFELKYNEEETELKVGQVSYIQDLLKRHGVTRKRTTPMAKVDELDADVPEENIQLHEIRAAQALTGELLWAAIRSRPDISFAVASMGRAVTKQPRKAVMVGNQVLEYLANTVYETLHYGRCQGGRGHEGVLPFERKMQLIEVYSDISFAPNAGRSVQATMACYGGELVQWESTRQSCITLSTAESELLGYQEAATMSDSVKALIEILEPEGELQGVLYGDNAVAISIVEKPDGPWRTRHLRLRSHFLMEKIHNEPWVIRHLSGVHLVADLLTKCIVSKASWDWFKSFIHLKDTEVGVTMERLAKINLENKVLASKIAHFIQEVTEHADIPEKDKEIVVKVMGAKFAEVARVVFQQNELLGYPPDPSLSPQEREQALNRLSSLEVEVFGSFGKSSTPVPVVSTKGSKEIRMCALRCKQPRREQRAAEGLQDPFEEPPKRAEGTEEAKVLLTSGRTSHQKEYFSNFDCFPLLQVPGEDRQVSKVDTSPLQASRLKRLRTGIALPFRAMDVASLLTALVATSMAVDENLEKKDNKFWESNLNVDLLWKVVAIILAWEFMKMVTKQQPQGEGEEGNPSPPRSPTSGSESEEGPYPSGRADRAGLRAVRQRRQGHRQPEEDPTPRTSSKSLAEVLGNLALLRTLGFLALFLAMVVKVKAMEEEFKKPKQSKVLSDGDYILVAFAVIVIAVWELLKRIAEALVGPPVVVTRRSSSTSRSRSTRRTTAPPESDVTPRELRTMETQPDSECQDQGVQTESERDSEFKERKESKRSRSRRGHRDRQRNRRRRERSKEREDLEKSQGLPRVEPSKPSRPGEDLQAQQQKEEKSEVPGLPSRPEGVRRDEDPGLERKESSGTDRPEGAPREKDSGHETKEIVPTKPEETTPNRPEGHPTEVPRLAIKEPQQLSDPEVATPKEGSRPERKETRPQGEQKIKADRTQTPKEPLTPRGSVVKVITGKTDGTKEEKVVPKQASILENFQPPRCTQCQQFMNKMNERQGGECPRCFFPLKLGSFFVCGTHRRQVLCQWCAGDPRAPKKPEAEEVKAWSPRDVEAKPADKAVPKAVSRSSRRRKKSGAHHQRCLQGIHLRSVQRMQERHNQLPSVALMPRFQNTPFVTCMPSPRLLRRLLHWRWCCQRSMPGTSSLWPRHSKTRSCWTISAM